MKNVTIPNKGFVLISRKEPHCQSCVELENRMIRLEVQYKKIDVVDIGVATMSVPKLYYDGELVLDGMIADEQKIKRIFNNI